MKSRISLSFLALAGLIMVVGLACGTTTNTPTIAPPPPPTQVILPTIAPTLIPTQPPPKPTIEPTIGPADYFTEDFSQDPGSLWSLVLRGPGRENTDKITTSFNNGQMRFNITGNDIYAYYFYTPYTYTDVRLDLRVQNIGVNSQNISLVCRANGDDWYEFSVGSDGLWYLYAHQNGEYDQLAQAGAATLKQGHATNDYTMICVGDKIHMYVNETELPYSPFSPKNYFFTDGEVGFNISSLDVTPVIVDVDWFQISQP